MKLIDLGGVRRIDDEESAIFGTVGYQAPEVPEVGPSVASRHLHDRPHAGRAVHGVPRLPGHLPPHACRRRTTTPLFQQHDSLYWLIAKCCAPDPADRFASADELRAQLLGVLREVVAAHDAGTALTSAASPLFEAPATSRVRAGLVPAARRCAPTPPTRSTPGSPASATPTRPSGSKALEQAPEESAEVLLRRARAALEAGRHRRRPRRRRRSCSPRTRGSGGRCGSTGLAAMKEQDWAAAQAAFSAVYQPGARASSRPSWRSRSPARTAGCPRSPRGSTPPAPPPTPPTPRRPRSAWRGCGPPAATPRGAVARPRPGAADQPRLPGEPAAAGRGAARPARRATSPSSTRR